jgi:adenylate cyclase
MFTDIADFTKVAEGMDSAELAKLMNNYFEEAISCVYHTDGFLVKLIGDALFAIWNAPIEQPDHIARVFQTALLLQQRVATFRAPNGIILRTRIGIHTGVADVGNFGSAKRFDYTAIGENINLASRLEGLNKHLGTHILASRDAQSAVADRFHFRCVGRFRLKGFEKTVEAYELLAAPADWQPIFAEALQHFASRNFDLAETAFCRILKVQPDDGPSRFYLSQLPQIRAHDLPSDWKGEVELLEK